MKGKSSQPGGGKARSVGGDRIYVEENEEGVTIILKEERGGKTDHQIEQEWQVDTVAERATLTQRPQ